MKNSFTKKSRAYQKPGRVGFSLLSLLGVLPIKGRFTGDSTVVFRVS